MEKRSHRKKVLENCRLTEYTSSSDRVLSLVLILLLHICIYTHMYIYIYVHTQNTTGETPGIFFVDASSLKCLQYKQKPLSHLHSPPCSPLRSEHEAIIWVRVGVWCPSSAFPLFSYNTHSPHPLLTSRGPCCLRLSRCLALYCQDRWESE